ncbi:unnamed protein product [Strongylus vulgaris]|uniref:WAP domain-containing protein n=1 Tax=Strongylus vulgaris TaxID=40348 RepID=A0A3P7JKY4_STRVU|nr:unnamed protein product [Strongylus vulgaris]
MPLKEARCSSTCSTDHDCVNEIFVGKCCFDGCGLTCYPVSLPSLQRKTIVPQRRVLFHPGDVVQHNKGMLSSLVADCPSSVEKSLVEKITNCSSLCESDDECPGMKRCCRIGCSTQCLYPVRTTPCFHAALTAELYEMRKVRRCDHAGKYEPIQCDYDGCFCVDVDSGEELSGTRTTNDTPNCKAPSSCPEMSCRTSCPYEYERESNGCPSCRCKNPCADVSLFAYSTGYDKNKVLSRLNVLKAAIVS